jgi:hypothetical protein
VLSDEKLLQDELDCDELLDVEELEVEEVV